jgi:hypothetical protein
MAPASNRENGMAAEPAVFISVARDAAEQVAQLGIQPEFEAMLDHTWQTIPGLRSISVSLDDGFEQGTHPTVLILAELIEPGRGDHSLEVQWDEWAVATFPADVNRHFCMMATYGTGHLATLGRPW